MMVVARVFKAPSGAGGLIALRRRLLRLLRLDGEKLRGQRGHPSCGLPGLYYYRSGHGLPLFNVIITRTEQGWVVTRRLLKPASDPTCSPGAHREI